MGMRVPKGCKDRVTAAQTVRKLLEQKRLQQSAQGHSPGALIPPRAVETSQPAEPLFLPSPATIEGRGPPRPTPLEYPVATFPTWEPDVTQRATFPPSCPYQPGDDVNCCLPSPGPDPYDVASTFVPLETSAYGAAGSGATEPVYSSKMPPALPYEAAAEAQDSNLYTGLRSSWTEQNQNNAYLPVPGNYQAAFVDVDPVELAQARAQIQNVGLTHLLQQDEDGDTCLHLFVAQGRRPLAYATAEMLRDCGRLDIKEHRGKTPLLVAAAANQPEIVKDLIMLGADVNAVDQKGQTVLHLATTYGLSRVIEAVMMTPVHVNTEARNFEGLTPLHCAVIAHNAAQGSEPLSQELLQCVRLLLQLGANYRCQDLKSNKTILHLAVQAANLPLIDFLLRLLGQKVQSFINMKAHGNTALHMAAGLHGQPFQEHLVHLLLQHGADPSARNLENEQPVHLLAPGPATEQLRLLLRSRRLGPGPAYLPSLP
ncbi:NF-kappa-B inhibitor delta isoform X3 [Pogona vitticeps]